MLLLGMLNELRKMKNVRLFGVAAACLLFTDAQAGDLFKIPDNAAQELPPGVPRTVDTNGRVVFIDGMFTTQAYQAEALRLVIQEANKVATEMKLPETLPITEASLTHAYIGPFGFNYEMKGLGNVTTSNYWYNIRRDYRFSDLTIANIDDHCREYAMTYRLSASTPTLLTIWRRNGWMRRAWT